MRGQISLEFSILFLALLVVVIVSTMTPGMYGYKKTIEVSSASLGHAAVSKLKNNIEMLSVSDEGSKKEILLKSPPGIWKINGTTITLEGHGFNISTSCNIQLSPNHPNYSTNMSGLTVVLTRNENNISINWTN